MASSHCSLQPTTPVSVAAQALLAKNLKRTRRRLRLAATALPDEVEHVHRLRISTRRSLAALDVFREYLPAGRAERIAKQMTKLRQLAAQARDLDVMIQQRDADLSSERKLLKRLRKNRLQAQKPIVSAYDSLRKRKSYRHECRKLLASLDRFDSAIQPQFSTWATRKLAIYVAVFFSQSPLDVTELKELHRFRVAAKKFRYILEILQPAFPANTYALVMPAFQRLQELLGQVNDHAVAIDRIRFMKDQGLKVDDGVLQREQEGLDSVRREFASWWTPETASELQQKLETLASL